MRLYHYILIFFFVLFLANPGFGQEDKQFNSDTIPSLDFDSEVVEETQVKKKKIKKKVYYGLKCRRGFTRKGVGTRETIENFYFLKHYKEPNPYAKKIYVFDVRKQQVVELSEIKKKDVKFYKVLHGPYKKTQGGEVVETGIFYIGTKHGRWEKYGTKKTDTYNGEEVTYCILLDKEKFYKGWPKESKITFYDGAQTKIKEVIPYEFGKMNGDYYFFKQNGEVMIEGKYMDGKKIGLWTEYDKDKNRKIRVTQYPASPYEEQFEPYVLTEWNEDGRMIIQKGQKMEPGQKPADPLKERYRRNKKK